MNKRSIFQKRIRCICLVVLLPLILFMGSVRAHAANTVGADGGSASVYAMSDGVDAPVVATLSNDNNKKGGIKTTTILAAISSALGFLVLFIKNKLADREGREEKRSRKKKSEKTGSKDGSDASDEPGDTKK